MGTLLLAACGGAPPTPAVDPGQPGQPGAPGGQAPTSQPGGGQATPAAPQPGEETVTVGLTAWNYGFEWEVLEATLSGVEERLFGREGRSLVVRVRLTNHGQEDGDFRGEVAALVDEGGQLMGATTTTVWANGSVGVNVPAGGSAEGELRFAVQPEFDLDRGFLFIGKRDENQAVVPLGPGGPQLVDLAPYVADLTGEISLELVDLSLRQVRITADRPHNNSALADGRRSVYVHFDFLHRLTRSFPLGPPNINLILPDGSREEPLNWGPSFTGLEPNTTHGLWLRFGVAAEQASGEYTFEYTPGFSFRGNDEPGPRSLTFTASP